MKPLALFQFSTTFKPVVDLAPQRLEAQVAAQEDRLDGLAEFGQRR